MSRGNINDVPENAFIENAYSELLHEVRLLEVKPPYSHAEDGFLNDLGWELHATLKVPTVKSQTLYRNNITGDYVVVAKIENTDLTEDEIKDSLEGRLEKISFGGGLVSLSEQIQYENLRARITSVKKEPKDIEITIEVLMPDSIRYLKISEYISKQVDKLN